MHEKTVKVLVDTLKVLEISCTVVHISVLATNVALILPFDLGFRLLCLYDCN